MGSKRKASSNHWLLLAAASAVWGNLSCGARSGLFLGGIAGSVGGAVASGGAAGSLPSGAGGAPTGGGPAGGSAAGGSKACGALIDDMEDGSGHICMGEGREGVWYVFNDDTGVQHPAKTNPGMPVETAVIPGGRGASTRAMHTDGMGFGQWGSGIGFDLDFDGTTYRLYDATRYAGFTFWARGLPGESMTFRVSSESTTAAAYGGTCKPDCAGPNGRVLALGPTWTSYTVSFAELNMFSGTPIETDRLTNVQFKFGLLPFDFWIDDIRFLESEPSCCPDRPECRGGVHVADAALRSAVLGSGAADQTLACSAVCSLRQLSSMAAGVRDLEGLECLSSVETLVLTQNQIADLSPLANSRSLVDLELAQNVITGLAPLTELTNLFHLDLSKNAITDIGPLAGLTGLSTLSLADNQITGVLALVGLVNLQQLQLSNNRIQDASPLGALVKLSSLDVSHNALRTTPPLSGLAKLTFLTLASNSISDLGTLSGLQALGALDVSDNRVVNVGPLASLHALFSLGLAKNQITDPSPLSALPALTYLSLSGNQIRALGPSFRVPSLTTLDLSSNGLSQLAALPAPTFQTLNLSHNQLVDLGALAGVTFANIGCYRCGDTPGLLDLSDNQVSDLSPLLAAVFPQTFTLDLRQNSISCAAQAANIAALRARGVALSVDCP